ncbi:MAG: EAL domain-containing protein [Rhizobiaceae bacterium]
MSSVKMLRSWAIRLFALFCTLFTCGAVVIVLSRSGIFSPDQSLMMGAILFFAVIILLRQFRISRVLKKIDAQFMALDEYEGDIQRRLDTLTQRMNAVQHSVDTAAASPTVQPNTALPVSANEAKPDKQDHPDLSSLYKIDAASSELHKINSANSEDDVDSVLPIPKATEKPDRRILPSKLDEKSLNMHLQPIVELPSRRPLYFDAFMRLGTTEGQFLGQKEFVKLAEAAGLPAKIDKKVIFSAVRMVRKLNRLKKQAGVFCAVSPTTLLSQENFSEILRFLKANSSIAGSIIIEIRQRDWVGLTLDQRDRVQELSDVGVPFSLGSALDLQLDTQSLARCGFKFVKVPVSILLHASIDGDSAAIQPSSLCAMLAAEGINLIATEVERDREAIGLIDIDVSLAQGLLFAPPRPVKAELLINNSFEDQKELARTDA